MRALRALLVRARGFFFRASTERDLAAELDSHLQLHIDDNLSAGMTAEEARRVALLRLGSVESVKEAYRDRAGMPSVDEMLRDVRFAWRATRIDPALTLRAE